MTDRKKHEQTQASSIADLYLDALRKLEAEHGAEYAFDAASRTMALLLSMSSMAMFRLNAPPLVLPSPPAIVPDWND